MIEPNYLSFTPRVSASQLKPLESVRLRTMDCPVYGRGFMPMQTSQARSLYLYCSNRKQDLKKQVPSGNIFLL